MSKTLLTVAAATAVLVSTGAANAVPTSSDEPKRTGSAGAQVLAALQRDLGLSAQEARQLGARQAEAVKLDAELQDKLGASYTGSVFDAKTGKLTVIVSQQSKLGAARAEGAGARFVDNSRAELAGITAELDAASGRSPQSREGRRVAGSKASPASSSLSSWYVDAATGTVRVFAVKGKLAQAKRAVAKYGDAVTVTEAPVAPVPTDRYFDGGDGYNGNGCSVGVNVRNRTTGQGYMVTAGHCLGAGQTVYGHDGVRFGPTLQRYFPTFDDAIVRNDSGGYWFQGAWVDTAPSHGGFISYAGYTDAPVGTVVCKSGIKTGFTCGSITVKNETVNYAAGAVYGLTRHSACVEKGDSGGANVAAFWNGSYWTYAAEGVTSGAQLWGATERCGQVVGQQNVSWYFPIADSLAFYGPAYGVSVW